MADDQAKALRCLNFSPDILSVHYTPHLVGLEHAEDHWNWLSREELQSTLAMLTRKKMPAAKFAPHEDPANLYVLTREDISTLLQDWPEPEQFEDFIA